MSWYDTKGARDDYVFSTRARLARNIKGFKFPCAMTAQESQKTADIVIDAMKPIISDYDIIDMSKASPVLMGELVEKHLISPNFRNGNLKRVALIAKDKSVSVMINEEDHVRIQCFCAGLNPTKALECVGQIDKLLRERIDFAFSEKYGYLTACPTNCGTALRLSAMVHLPALAMSGAQGQLLRDSAKLGMTVRGMYGEGSEAPGNIYQISNQVTLGVSVNDIYEKFCSVIESILNAEKTLREKIKSDISVQLKDKIYRACALLKGSYLMSSSEFLNLQSLARLGAYIGITDIDIEKLKRLWIETSPCTMGNLPAQKRDIKRAQMIREQLKNADL